VEHKPGTRETGDRVQGVVSSLGFASGLVVSPLLPERLVVSFLGFASELAVSPRLRRGLTAFA